MTDRDDRWTTRKLAVVFYPFAAAAVAINLFLLSLIGIVFGLSALAPLTALWLSLPLGIPATWLAAKWIRRLMDEADGNTPPAG